MRIGITTFGGDGGHSGISRYIIQLIREFAKMKENEFEVVVYEDEKDIFIPPGATNIHALVYPASLRSTSRNLMWHQQALPKLCAERKWDVLFLPAGNRRLPYRSPCPTVGTVHDFSSLHVKGKYDRAHMVYIQHILPALCRRLDRVITISEASKQDILTHARVPEEKITIIPHAADPAVYYPRDPDESHTKICKSLGLCKPYLLYVSRIEHPGKNHVRLIQAFAQLKAAGKLKDYQLVLAGKDWLGADAVHVEAEKCGYTDDVKFLGFVSDEDLPLLYAAADIFLFPSLYEGFGLPVLEAMGMGVPVACANASSLPEVMGDVATYFDPLNVEDIGRAIEKLLSDPAYRLDSVERGLARAKEFCWSKTAEATMEVLRSAASSPHAATHA